MLYFFASGAKGWDEKRIKKHSKGGGGGPAKNGEDQQRDGRISIGRGVSAKGKVMGRSYDLSLIMQEKRTKANKHVETCLLPTFTPELQISQNWGEK